MKMGSLLRCSGVEIAKALVLAGRTLHDRPWPSVRSGPRQLVPVANRPILFHHLESLQRTGVLEAMIALDHEGAEPIAAAVGDGSDWGMSIRYLAWQPATGLHGALSAARDFVGDEPVMVSPADALHRERIHPHIAAFAKERLDAMALTVSGAPLGAHGYLLSRRAVSILVDGPEAILDPMAGVRRHGGSVRVQAIDGCLACHGGQERLLEGNRRMLEELQGGVDAAAYPTCRFEGPVHVDPSAELEHTLIRGPAVIGARSVLSRAYVGPYTSIGADVRIEGSEIEHSIVLDRAQLLHVGSRLDTSVIGYGARVERAFALPASMRLSVGDGAEVLLS
jgi:glucose-1-phosphate thymidylyltransferase